MASQITRNRLITVIIEQIRQTTENQEIDVPADLGEDTILFGQRGFLDSLAMVALVVLIEQAVANETGAHIALADERAMSQTKSPFRTVGTLANYTLEVLNHR